MASAIAQADLSRLLHTNQVPSDPEARYLKRALNDTRISLHAIEQEISKTLGFLRQLSIRRDTFRESERLFQSAVSPIRRLPPELLVHIFKYIPQQEGCSSPAFCQVASRWRRVALGTPALWTSIKTEPTLNWDSPGQQSIRALWFERTASMPVSLEMTLKQDAALPSNPLMAILPILSKVHNLRIDAPSTFMDYFLHSPATPIHSLHTITLNTRLASSSSQIFPTAKKVSLFDLAPNLQHAYLYFNDAALDPFILNLPWSQLTLLHFYDVQFSVVVILDLFSQCTQLQECIISVDPEDDRGLSSCPEKPSIIMQSLQSLELNLHSVESIDLFRPLILPQLTNLEIISDGPFRWHHSVFMDLQSRSLFNLVRLWLHNVPVSTSCLIEFLAQNPAISTLYLLDSVWFTHRFITALISWDHDMPNRPRAARNTLVPNLNSLSLQNEGRLHGEVGGDPINPEPDFTYEDIMTLLESRWWPTGPERGYVACLHEFNVASPGRFLEVDHESCDWAPRFTKLLEEGLVVRFTEEEESDEE